MIAPAVIKTQPSFTPTKLFYFAFFAALAGLAPYLTLYYQESGLTGRQIGLLAGLPPLIGLVSAPLFGALADATHQHQRLLGFTITGLVLSILAISMADGFWAFVLTVSAYALFMAPIIPLIDNSVLESLGVQSARYGKIRLWGSVGWGLAAPPVGLFLEWAGLHWGFYLCAGGMLVLLAVSFRLPLGQPDVTHRFWAGLRLLLVNWQWPVFLLVVFIGGAGLSIIHNYLFLFVAQLGGSKSLMGAALSIATISELGIMFFSNPLLTRWRARTLLYVALLTLAVRGLAYAYTQAPWPVLVIQLLHGPSFALLWIAGVAHAHRIAPPGLKATAQGLFFGVTTGLGGAFGAIAGGWLYESLGLAVMFWWIGLGMLACLLLFIAAGALRRRPL